MNEARNSNGMQSQPQSRGGEHRNFWSLLDDTNLPQRASALVSVVVQPLDPAASGDLGGTRNAVDGGSRISCPSCGYDLTNFLANPAIRKEQMGTGQKRNSSQSNRNSNENSPDSRYGAQSRKEQEPTAQSNNYNDTGSNSVRQSPDNQDQNSANCNVLKSEQRDLAGYEPYGNNVRKSSREESSIQPDSATINNDVKPDQRNSQSAQSAGLAQQKSIRGGSFNEPNSTFNPTEYPVCIETIRNSPSVLSSSRLYMQDIKVVQNMRECWERFLELRLQHSDSYLPPENDPGRLAPPEGPRRENRAVQTSSTNTNPDRLENSTKKVSRNRGPSSIKSANKSSQNSPQLYHPFQEIQDNSEQKSPPNYSDERAMEPGSNRRRSSQQPTHISSEEKVQQWMERNNSKEITTTPNSAINRNSQGKNQTSQAQKINNKGETIIEMATDFDLVSCGGAVVAEVEQSRRPPGTTGRGSARNSKGSVTTDPRNSSHDNRTANSRNTNTTKDAAASNNNNNNNNNLEQSEVPSASFEEYEC